MPLFAVRLTSPTKRDLWLTAESSGTRRVSINIDERELFTSYEDAMVALSQLSEQLRDVLEYDVVEA
jgi:hypothetical protein